MRTCVAVLFVSLVTPAVAADWVRLASPGIEVLTDAGERTGRQLLARFEEIHRTFHQANIADSPLAVRVFVFSSEQEFHSYREGQATQGFYQSGPERDYIVMHAGAGAARVAYHEYVHVVLNHSSASLPTWFEEGTAEFYSTLETERGRLFLGRPIESHLAMLASERWLTAGELASVTPASSYYTERDRVGIFYAQSWALVHMLNLAPSWREGMPQFALLMAEGRGAQGEAFKQAFGRSMDQAMSDLGGYLRSIRGVSIPGQPAEISAEFRKAEHLTPIEATIARVDLALQVRRREVARALLEKARRDNPQSADVTGELGMLALAEDRKDEARRYLEQAIALGSREGATYFEYAMLARDTGAKRDRVDQLLERVIAVNPNFAEAHFLLGVHATDDGRFEPAIAHLREAVRILPRQSYFWHALGYAEWQNGRTREAAESARRALATAANAHEAGMAETLADRLHLADRLQESVRNSSPAKRPAVITPSSWQGRKGDARVKGVLTGVDCQPGAARLHITVEGKAMELNVSRPEGVELVNPPREPYEFSCGPQQVGVVIEYVGASGEVTRIEFLR